VRRLALLGSLLGALLSLAIAGGSARADTFAVLPTTPFTAAGTLTPNVTLAVPDTISTPPAVPATLSSSQLLGLWQRAGAAYGIPWQVLGAINKIESNFGRNMGPSSAGAIGWMQFMPSTWLRWGVDASGDGVADPWDPTDAVFAAARYLAAAGGTSDLYRGVYAYNHADWYVREVLQLADLYGGDSTIAFSLDRMQADLDAARRAAAQAGERVIAARSAVRAESRVVARWQARADGAALLSDRLAFEQQAGLARGRLDTAAARLAQRRQALGAAVQRVAQAEQASESSSFDPAASQLLSGPSYSGGYVFPVGGGPSAVSASHTHHDYPAVDIAAPMGAPLYALADATVLRSWTAPDPRCGIGLTLRAFDGQVWTYCHLSVLDSNVVAGATLTAGEPVGLVGATGDASGPHLHLQLQPASAWPQQEAWFQSFAGRAFTWQDAGGEPARELAFAARPAPSAAGGPSSGPVFAVVPDAAPAAAVVYFSR
jgi:murein DD-endopeptidase MepM/ murein hydrolase activator NlpD